MYYIISNCLVHLKMTLQICWVTVVHVIQILDPLVMVCYNLYTRGIASRVTTSTRRDLYIYEIYFPEPSSSSDVWPQTDFSRISTCVYTHWRKIIRWHAILNITQYADVPDTTMCIHPPFLKSRLLELLIILSGVIHLERLVRLSPKLLRGIDVPSLSGGRESTVVLPAARLGKIHQKMQRDRHRSRLQHRQRTSTARHWSYSLLTEVCLGEGQKDKINDATIQLLI